VSTTRRKFLFDSSRLAAAGLTLGVGAGASAATMAPDALAAVAVDEGAASAAARIAASFDPQDWSSVRAQFRLDPKVAHLCNFFLASNPASVREAIERYRRELDVNPYSFLDDHMFARADDMLWRNVAGAAAQYVGGRPEDIALTSSTTMGLALIYNGLRIEPHQEVLTTTHDFYPHHESIRLAIGKWGGSMRKVSLYDSSAHASADEMVARLIREVRPQTRVVGVTWVHSGTGVVLPVRDVADAIAHINRARTDADRVLLVVDGVHGFGILDDDIARQGSDFFAAGTHKWILGPHGTGIVWGREDNWALLQPTIPSLMAPEPSAAWRAGRMPVGPTRAAWVSPGGFFAYENQWAVVEAFRFHQRIGRKRVEDRILALNGQIREGLAGMSHVRLHTPLKRELTAGFVCFDVNSKSPDEVVERLRQRGVIASTTPYGTSCARLSAGLVNTDADIERVLSEIRAMA
jgi:isopenicillin-N epimerase